MRLTGGDAGAAGCHCSARAATSPCAARPACARRQWKALNQCTRRARQSLPSSQEVLGSSPCPRENAGDRASRGSKQCERARLGGEENEARQLGAPQGWEQTDRQRADMEENEARQNEKIGGASGAEPFLDHGYGFCLTLAHVQHTARLRAPPLISSDPAQDEVESGHGRSESVGGNFGSRSVGACRPASPWSCARSRPCARRAATWPGRPSTTWPCNVDLRPDGISRRHRMASPGISRPGRVQRRALVGRNEMESDRSDRSEGLVRGIFVSLGASHEPALLCRARGGHARV